MTMVMPNDYSRYQSGNKPAKEEMSIWGNY